ncbi:hypothetical protein GCM10027047_02240 [Rhodococcus aerolatus]
MRSYTWRRPAPAVSPAPAGTPDTVHHRMLLAGEVLTGLALVGSEQRSALDRAAGWDAHAPVPAETLLAALEAVSEQARLTARAGRRAGDGGRRGWLAGTAEHWHAYLGWLGEQLEAHATAVPRVVGPGRDRVEAALRTARADCAAARLGWAAG